MEDKIAMYSHSKTLVLNASYEPLAVVSWKRAFLLCYLDKAEPLESYQKKIYTARKGFEVPAVIRLYKRVKHIHISSSFNRKALFERDNHTCQYCGMHFSKALLTMDHIIPKSKGGPKTWENIVTACVDCNNYKGDRTPKEASMGLLSKPRKPFLVTKKHSPKEWSAFLWG